MDVIIQCGLRVDRAAWTLSSIVVMMYILELSLSSTISCNVTHMVVIMKTIFKVVWHHIFEIICGIIVPTTIRISVGILKIGNVVVNFYVKSSGTIKIYKLIMNRLTKTFVVSIQIILSTYPLGPVIITRFWNNAYSFIVVEFFSEPKSMFLIWLH